MGNNPAKQRQQKREYIENLRSKVPNLDVNEIKEVYDNFKQHSKGRNRLTKKDFKKVYKRAFGDKASGLSEHIFNAFDVNGDGKVSFEEFLIGVSMTDNRQDKAGKLARLKWAFDVYDADKSGTIDRGEMRSLVKAVFDISPSHNHGTKTPEDFADDLFREVDANGDGDITFQEFCDAADRNENLIDMLMPAPDDDGH